MLTCLWTLLPGLLVLLPVTGALQVHDDAENYKISINTSQVLSVTEDSYIGFTLDFSLKVNHDRPWYTLNFSNPRVHTLAKGLAPADLRFGGTNADFAVFYDESDKDAQQDIIRLNALAVDKRKDAYYVTIFPHDIDQLYSLSRSAGGRLIYDLSMEMRYGPQWDSTKARTLINYLIRKGYAQNVDFELGNEPPYKKFTSAAFKANGERIAKDFKLLRQVLDYFPELRHSRLLGPDVETPRDGSYSGEQPDIMRDFVSHIDRQVSAVTAHHYYFTGPIAKLNQFYDLKYFKLLESTLPLLRQTVYKAAGAPIDIWIGETADSNLGGTPHITNSYASGFLWLDKLGLAAKNQIKKVIRQTFYGYNNTANYPLINSSFYPNPDYWLSHVYSRLVGRAVFNVTVNSQSAGSSADHLLRAYAHCTSSRSGYQTGSIVLYAINLNTNSSALLSIDSVITTSTLDAYVMTPVDSVLTSRGVQLNGKTLAMLDDYTLPKLEPEVVPAEGGVTLPPLTFAFYVLKAEAGKDSPVNQLCSSASQI